MPNDLNAFIVRPAPEGALAAPNYIEVKKLQTAGTAETVTIPANANIVVFTTQDNEGVFYARWDGSAAAVPSGDTTDGTASEVNPDVRFIPGVQDGTQTFSIVSPYKDTLVIMAFYRDDEQAPNAHRF